MDSKFTVALLFITVFSRLVNSSHFLRKEEAVLFGNVTVVDDEGSFVLVKDRDCSRHSSQMGRVFYPTPFHLEGTDFTSSFSFLIHGSVGECFFPDGISLLLTPDSSSLNSTTTGYMGIPGLENNEDDISEQLNATLLAIQFHIRTNRVSIFLEEVLSSEELFESYMVETEIKTWIQYNHKDKEMTVWVGYSNQERPERYLVQASIDIATELKGPLMVGITAASGGYGAGTITLRDFSFTVGRAGVDTVYGHA